MLHSHSNAMDNNNIIQQHSHSAKTDKYWLDSPNQQYDRNLNFAAIGSEDDDYASFSKSGGSKGSNINKAARDPQSHRIIEKRRRDRMNNCLADLSRLLPPACMKKGRGRIEKTEIIEMTIKHMKHLQIHACKDVETCEIALQMEQNGASKADHYRSGFLECITETMDYISHHLPASNSNNVNEEFCSKLFAHLHNYCDKTTSRLVVDGTGSEAGDLYPVNVTGRVSSHHGGGIINNIHEDDATRGSESSPLPPVQVTLIESPFHGSEKKEDRDQVYFHGDADHCNKNNRAGSTNSQKVHHRPSSGSVSGGDSDETNRSDRATRNSNTPSPMDGGSSSGPSPAGCNGDGESYNSSHSGGSQHSSGSSSLRQMLLSNGEETSTRTKSCSSSSTSSSSRSSVVHSSSNQNDDSNSTYKKFKTNIHQRFTADLEHVVDFQHSSSDCMTNQSESKKENQRTFDTTAAHGVKRKKMEQEDARHNNTFWNQNGFPGVAPLSPPSSSSTRASAVGPEVLDSRILQKHLETVVVGQPQSLPAAIPTPSLDNVPIFALHPKGTYYVPMSVEMNMIRGLFHSSDNQSSPLLHPVTISVNFCHPVQVLATPSVVIPPPPPSVKVAHQDSIMPALRPVLSPPLMRHQIYDVEESTGLRQHARESTAHLKMTMQHRAVAEYGHHQHQSSESVLRREYPIIRQSRGEYHHQQQHNSGNNSLTHSSRWSHLMAKRTHTP